MSNIKIDSKYERNKILLLIAALVLAAAVGFARISFRRGESPGEVAFVSQETQVLGEITSYDLVLDFGEGKIATYSAVRSEKGTILDLLLEAAERYQFKVDYEVSEMGAWIKSVAGVENTKDQFWMFWVNGKMAEKAADKQEIRDRDKVEFRFTKM